MTVRGLKISVTAAVVIWANTCFCAEIPVVVKDERNRPVKDAILWVVPCDRHGAFLEKPKPLRTDAKGEVKVSANLLASGMWEVTHLVLWAEKGEYRSFHRTWSRQVGIRGKETLPLRLTLRPTAKVAFNAKIVNPKGLPVGGAHVFLWRVLGAGGLSPLLGFWTTDKSGQVRNFVWLPLSFISAAQLYDLPLRFIVVAYHPEAGWAGATVDIKGLTNLSLSLSPHRQTELKVRDCFGEPLKGLNGRLAAVQVPNVTLLAPLPANLFAFKTDSSGEVVLPIPQNGKGLWEWCREAPRGLKREAETVWLNAGTSQTIQFHSKTIRATGRLIDAQTGKPLEGEGVILLVMDPTSMSVSLPFCSKTNKEGRFFIQTKTFLCAPTGVLLDLPDGRRLLLWGSPKLVFFKPPLPSFQCQQWVITDIVLDPPDAKISGTVVDGQGKPVPFAFVSGMNVEPQRLKPVHVKAMGKSCDGSLWEISKQVNGEKVFPYAYTFADQKGRFQMRLRAGTWRFSALWVGSFRQPPQLIPDNATFLWPRGIGPITLKGEPSKFTLKISKGAEIKVKLTLSGWANFWWHVPQW